MAVATGLSETGYIDTAVTNGTKYYYVVTASNSAGESIKSNEASATPGILPTTPENLRATAGSGTDSGTVTLIWNSSWGAARYNIKRATTSGGPYTTIANDFEGSSYVDTTVAFDTTYYYIVTATFGNEESQPSNEASVTIIRMPPGSVVLTAAAGSGKVSLMWTESSGAVYYNVWRSATMNGPFTVISSGVDVTTYEDTEVSNGTKYYYIVTALNAGAESVPSNIVSAVPLG